MKDVLAFIGIIALVALGYFCLTQVPQQTTVSPQLADSEKVQEIESALAAV